MNSIIGIFRILAKEFEEIADEEVDRWIELTKPMVSEKVFGVLYPQALALMGKTKRNKQAVCNADTK